MASRLKVAAPSASFGQGEGRFPETSPLHDIYRDWERRFNEQLVIGWQRKFERLIPELRKLYPDKAGPFRVMKMAPRAIGLYEGHRLQIITAWLKAEDDLIGLPPEFWVMWENGYIADILPFMEEAARMSVDIAVGDLEANFAVSVEPGRVDTDVADWAFQHTMHLVRESSPLFKQTLTDTDKKNLRGSLASWIETGGTFPELVTKIQEGTWMSHSRAATIAATEATRAYAEGALATWRESGVIDQKRWSTARDEIVCPVCRPLDGVTVGLNELFFTDLGEVDGPPAHVNCRCHPTPVVSSELGDAFDEFTGTTSLDDPIFGSTDNG